MASFQVAFVETYLVTDHCIELLGQAVTCHADSSLQTYSWTAKSEVPQFDVESPSVHMCVDWDVLLRSLRHRIVPTEEMGRLKRPF